MFLTLTGCIAQNPSGRYGGITIADVDGDGRFEVLVAGSAGPNRVLKWINGQLRDIAPPLLADPDRSTIAIAAGDLDGDGNEELFVLNNLSPDRLLKRDLDGQWLDLFASSPFAPRKVDNHTHALRESADAFRGAKGDNGGLAALDRRGVGRYGFFVSNPSRLIEQGTDGTLADLARSVGLAAPNDIGGILAAPLDDTHTDLFFLNRDGANAFYRNLGDGAFEDCTRRLHLADADEQGQTAVAVDADDDGRLDLCWGNRDGPHRLMVRSADGTWRDRATPALAMPSSVRTILAADFDNDGRDELFFNNCGEPNRLFRLPADDRSVMLLDPGDASEPEGVGTGAAVADLDDDGVLELIVAHGEGAAQPLSVFKARSARGNSWLRIRPLTRFGAPARGALVRASVAGRIAVKAIDASSEPVAHFGLGRNSHIHWVTVTWPDGASLKLPNPDVNCTYSVPYPRG